MTKTSRLLGIHHSTVKRVLDSEGQSLTVHRVRRSALDPFASFICQKIEEYHKVGGEPFVRKAVTMFYERAFSGPIIGHFFVNLNHSELVEKQTSFTRSMLGDMKVYQGKPLVQVHKNFPIRGPHFGRRQVLMRQVLEEMELAPQLIKE